MASFADLLKVAPLAGYLFLGGSVLLVASLMETFLTFMNGALNVDAFLGMINKLVLAQNVDRALKLCQAAGSKSTTGQLVYVGLVAYRDGGSPMQAMEPIRAMTAARGRKKAMTRGIVVVVAVVAAAYVQGVARHFGLGGMVIGEWIAAAMLALMTWRQYRRDTIEPAMVMDSLSGLLGGVPSSVAMS
jgi:hypothetical protein